MYHVGAQLNYYEIFNVSITPMGKELVHGVSLKGSLIR
jgi:hypothetical protein